MLLLTGTSLDVPSSNMILLTPKIFNTMKDTSKYVEEQFHILSGIIIPDGWEMSVQVGDYKIYAERINGIVTYHAISEKIHIEYRVDIIDKNNTIIPGKREKPFYWNISDNPLIKIALSLSLITGYVYGNTVGNLPTTYEDVDILIPEDDIVTLFLIMYTMMRVDGKNAVLYVQDGYLYLYGDQGFIGTDISLDGIDNDSICNPAILYQYSKYYRDIPSTINELIIQYNIKDTDDFRRDMDNILQPGIRWKEQANIIANRYGIDNDVLNKMIGKYKLLKGSNMILSQYPICQ